jgi:hypothetical protein
VVNTSPVRGDSMEEGVAYSFVQFREGKVLQYFKEGLGAIQRCAYRYLLCRFGAVGRLALGDDATGKKSASFDHASIGQLELDRSLGKKDCGGSSISVQDIRRVSLLLRRRRIRMSASNGRRWRFGFGQWLHTNLFPRLKEIASHATNYS